MKVSDQIIATGQVPPTLRRYGCTATTPADAAAWLRAHPLLDHDVLPPLHERLRTVRPAAEKKMSLREQRVEQRAFRERVGRAYGWRCAVTGFRERAGLQAAHLTGPDSWRQHNRACHGVLLRSDLHGLFDAGLIKFERGCVVVTARVKDASVRALHGTPLRLPQRRADWPDSEGR